MTDVDMETVSCLIASEYRIATCRALSESMATPTGISDELGKEPSHVSRALSELQDRGVVELMVEEDRRKGRIYALTERGEDAFEQAMQVKR